ncbi:BTAD domain-containing putative transcriptional regulator [Streptomyces yaanensis]|uniref:BTAD domain-containing putative transcriptional regulator n=1 Tax=Streptomyces yaanensis TaxID=1142239 RepID=A0ABV7S9Q1_9ACTN|nr:BTAD domain-containing putative transcriptional regulator [Streptomyces sp. CGMCC 4.7035]WNB96720.1 BTAD domain-containing putative transcriptional regulator [Streptomyces sp. CGMCC 4.7035]
MRFGILGGTQVWSDDGTEVSLGGPARRALLTLLLVTPGEVVPADRLADGIGAAGPDGAPSAHAIQSQVSRLRSALGGAAAIERTGAGYRIVAADDDVDAGRFERLAREGRSALREGDAARAVPLLREALRLWRGPALADLADSEPARAAAVRLEELRLGALEDRIEGELRLGEHRTVIPELRELVDRHPLRERLAGLLMRALFADGGQAAALVVFERVRRHLAEELGADPSAELVALHGELLSADPSPAPAAPPAPLTAFVGRDDETAEVVQLLRVARLVTLTGPGGVGKTRLSAEVAGAAADEVCFVELGALRDAAVLPRALLGALGLRESGLHVAADEQSPLDRLVAALTGRVLLLVLDNCEHLVEEVAVLAARLLATCPRLRVLATSREPLGIIGEHLHPVRPLDDASSVALFTDRARAVRRAFAPDPETVRRVCADLDNLPLAIELAAARLRTLSLDELSARLHDRLALTGRGSRTADARHRTLRSVVAWSWDLLSEPEQRAARRFSVFAGGTSIESALRVCDTDEETLQALADKSLLEWTGGRCRMLETIRSYGAERLDAAGETEAVRHTHARTLVELMSAAAPWLRRGEQLEWLAALAAEQPDLLAAVRWAAEAQEVATGLELIASASSYLWIRGGSGTLAPQARILLDAVGDTPPAGLGEEYAICLLVAASGPAGREVWRRHRASADKALTAAWSADRAGRHPAGLLLWMMHNATGDGDAPGAFALVSAQRDRPEPWVRAAARYVSGFGPLGVGDFAAAERAFRTAVAEFRALGDRWGAALALDALAGVAGARGEREATVALTDEALGLAEQLGALEDCADLLVNRGDQQVDIDPATARADYLRAAEYARRAGSTGALAAARRGLGDTALLERDPATAEDLYTQALEQLDPHWVKGLGNRVRTLAGLGRIAEGRGDHAGARARYREAAESAAVTGAALPDALRLLGLPEPLVEVVSRG